MLRIHFLHDPSSRRLQKLVRKNWVKAPKAESVARCIINFEYNAPARSRASDVERILEGLKFSIFLTPDTPNVPSRSSSL